ncbi:MAG: hypothetical protein BWY72_02507 [Bacteroidetes bacterium ADurb.Bin416]|nr:MAG: hypothetical protein BWY72_02507 [Bacteroidetes bacterium ADurb.Bin416]
MDGLHSRHRIFATSCVWKLGLNFAFDGKAGNTFVEPFDRLIRCGRFGNITGIGSSLKIMDDGVVFQIAGAGVLDGDVLGLCLTFP